MESHSPELENVADKAELAAAAGSLSLEGSVVVGDSLPPMPKQKIDEIDRNKGVNPVYGDNLPLGPAVQSGSLHSLYFA
jgi:hypothetical protein